MLRKLSLFLLILVFVSLAVSSLPSLFASIYAHQFERHERIWNKTNSVSIESWDSSLESLYSALSLEPSNPEYMQQLGRLYSWSGHASLNHSNKSLEGIESFRNSLLLRPYWANGWSGLVYLKFIQGEIDVEFWQAYKNAMSAGMWEKEVIFNLTNAGVGAWAKLNLEQRIVVVEYFKVVSTFDKKIARKMLSIISGYNMGLPFCYALKSMGEKTFLDQPCKRYYK